VLQVALVQLHYFEHLSQQLLLDDLRKVADICFYYLGVPVSKKSQY